MQNLSNSKLFLYMLIVICGMCWGLSFLVTTIALKYTDTMELLALRWAVPALFFIFAHLIGIYRIDIKGKPLKAVILTALCQPCIYSIFETNGIGLTTTSESSIFIALIPVAALIISIMLKKEKNNFKTIFSILIAFSGISVCIGLSPAFSFSGKYLGYGCLLGAIFFGALYTHASKGASRHFNSLEITVIMSVIAGIFFNVINLIRGNGINTYVTCFQSSQLLICTLFLGVFCSCICYLINNYVIKKLPVSIAANVVANTTTSIGVLSGCIFAGDPFGIYTVVGLILTIAGIILASKSVEPNN